MWKRENSWTYRDSNPNPSVVQHDYAILASSTVGVTDIKQLLEKILRDSSKLYINSATQAI
jgi:hypothetical protein